MPAKDAIDNKAVRASQEEYWKKAPEYGAAEKMRVWAVGIGGVASVALIVSLGLVIYSRVVGNGDVSAIGMILLTVAVVLAIFIALPLSLTWSRQWEVVMARLSNELILDARRKEEDAIDSLNLQALWKSNQELINGYHSIVTTQARSAHASSRTAMGAGLCLLLLVGVVAIVIRDATTQYVLGALGGIGAGISAYIAATYVKVQSDANAQLRVFFEQPIESARFYNAERLIGAMPKDQQPEATRHIISALTGRQIGLTQTPDSTPSPTTLELSNAEQSGL